MSVGTEILSHFNLILFDNLVEQPPQRYPFEELKQNKFTYYRRPTDGTETKRNEMLSMSGVMSAFALRCVTKQQQQVKTFLTTAMKAASCNYTTLGARNVLMNSGTNNNQVNALVSKQAVSAVNPTRGFATVVDGLKYAESHEWVKLDGDTGTIGITDFAQSELGDVVYVELPEVGSTVTAKETFGVVESVKAASDVYSPVSGEVIEVNDALVDDPSKLNSEPFEGGWMMKIKVSDASEADGLMDSAAYSAQCEE